MENNELTIITKENELIANAPKMFEDCKVSHDRCIEAGKTLLEKIKASGNLDEDLDQECALYIERTKKTLSKINNARSPLTKMLDEVKKTFTTMENEVDVAKVSSIPAQIQEFRNRFAAEIRAAEERRRQEEFRRQAAENARKQWRSDCAEEAHRFLNAAINKAVDELTQLNASITLDNFNEQSLLIKNYPCNIPDNWDKMFLSQLRLPLEIQREEAESIKIAVYSEQFCQFSEQYRFDVESTRDDLYNRLPSKKKELEALAKASAQEAEQRMAEIAAQEAENARRKEEERKAREEEERKRAELEKQNAEMDTLFNQAAVVSSAYSPKASVKKKIHVLNVEGYSEIFSMWWVKVGCYMSAEELSKTFKSQITFCEKLANDKGNPVFIESEHIEYIDEIKAK